MEQTPAKTPIASPLKWVGGKTRLLPELLSRLPPDIDSRLYIEPFLGGGALFFALQPRRAVLSDLNADLIETYRTIRDNPDELIAHLEQLKKEAADYYTIRARFNSIESIFDDTRRVEHAALFIYLNKTCFNGLYRVNKAGVFNVPEGSYKNPSIFNAVGIFAASAALKTATILHQSFDAVRSDRPCFVYFDPPYIPVKAGSFVDYTQTGFSLKQHTRLRDLFVRLAEQGDCVMLSNSATDTVRELYRGYRIEEVFAPRSVNSKGEGRGRVPELIIRNY